MANRVGGNEPSRIVPEIPRCRGGQPCPIRRQSPARNSAVSVPSRRTRPGPTTPKSHICSRVLARRRRPDDPSDTLPRFLQLAKRSSPPGSAAGRAQAARPASQQPARWMASRGNLHWFWLRLLRGFRPWDVQRLRRRDNDSFRLRGFEPHATPPCATGLLRRKVPPPARLSRDTSPCPLRDATVTVSVQKVCSRAIDRGTPPARHLHSPMRPPRTR